MAKYLIAYGTTAFVFLVIDLIWLSKVAKQFYQNQLGDILLESPRVPAAIAFYVVYIAGIVFFAVAPALRSDSMVIAVLHGALFGFFAYATYDLTNYATLKNWPLLVSVADIAWGTFLTGICAAAGFWAARLLTQTG